MPTGATFSPVDTVNAVSERSQFDSATRWNATHDRMRALPVELRLLCLGSLPTADKCKLSRVCSFWRDTIARDPAIWTQIDVLDRPLDLAAMLRRSQQLPVDVAVSARTQDELRLITMVLRLHAHRLRRLKMSLLYKSVAMTLPSFTRLFDFAVPQLRALELRATPWPGADRFIIPPGIFNGNAPQLRSLALYGVGVPSDNCPALANITAAFVQGLCPGLKNILKTMKALERLELVNVFGHPRHGLPELGTHAALADVCIHDARPDYASLQSLGYVTRLARLQVTSADGIAAVSAAAAHLAPRSECTLVIGPSGATELLISHADGRTASFAAENLFFREIRTSLASFRDITRLVLPLYLNTTDYTSTGQRTCPLLPGDVELVLPRLVSLTIRCALYSGVGCELLDPAIARGSIVAPLLARLEITGGPMDRGKLFYVCPGELATFVEDHLKLAPDAQLEVVIDAANGVKLWSVEKDIARLRRCVGQLIL